MTDPLATPRTGPTTAPITAPITAPMAAAEVRQADGFTNGKVSFWYDEIGLPTPGARLPGSREVDVCIVGAGFTGLWTAYYLKRAQPDLRITVLEREFAGFGASGRNGGWVLGELAGLRRRYADSHGRAATIDLQREMFHTVDEVIKTAADEGIEADIVKGGYYTVARNAAQVHRLREMVAHDREWGWTDADIRVLTGQEGQARLRVAGALEAAWSPHCARVQPAKLARGLAKAVAGLGVDIFEQTPVTRIRPRGGAGRAAAVTPYGTVCADYVIRATEGFTAELAGHHRDWLPMNSSMIVTTPLPDEVWDHIGWAGAELLGDMAHYYMYAQRTADGRIAFGGRGRPYRYGSKVDDAGVTQDWTVETLWRMLITMFPSVADHGGAVAHAWSGVLGVPRDWCSTAVLDHVTGLGHAGGYTGHGVATTNLAGRTLRDLVLRRDTKLTRLPWVDRRVRRWEPEPLRWLGVQLMYTLYQTADGRETKNGRPTTHPTAWLADRLSGR